MGSITSNVFKKKSLLKTKGNKFASIATIPENSELLSGKSSASDAKKRRRSEGREEEDSVPEKKSKRIAGQRKTEGKAATHEESRSLAGGDPLVPGTEHRGVSELTQLARQGVLSTLESAPDSHHFRSEIFKPKDPRAFTRVVRKELEILNSSLPDGIVVKSFEDRIDLFTVMIKGPKGTPYEDGLFFFDILLPDSYPKYPPLCHYVSYSKHRLNPNLYESGKVCVSLLGTWPGKGTQLWKKNTSNLLQVVVSIQGLILVSEPYFNEPAFEVEKGKDSSYESSREYNVFVVLNLAEAMTNLIKNPPELFQKEVFDHFRTSKFVDRLEQWLAISESWDKTRPSSSASATTSRRRQDVTEFPLIPILKDVCPNLRKSLEKLKSITKKVALVRKN